MPIASSPIVDLNAGACFSISPVSSLLDATASSLFSSPLIHTQDPSSSHDEDQPPPRLSRRRIRPLRRRHARRGARRGMEVDQERHRPAYPGARRVGGGGARQGGQRQAEVQESGGRKAAGLGWRDLSARCGRGEARRQGRRV